MTLRPRYSLLTLLLLTAAIAGGMKLWRGPHRAVMSNPPTAEERACQRAPMNGLLAAKFGPMGWEYDFVRAGEGRQGITVTGRPTTKKPIIVVPRADEGYTQLMIPLLLEQSDDPLFVRKEVAQVVSWVIPVHRLGPGKAVDFANLELQGATHQAFLDVSSMECYFVTDRREIYRAISIPYLFIPVAEVLLAEIDDPILQARLEEELARLPSQN